MSCIEMADASVKAPSVSLLRLRLRRFRSIKRGYYSFLVLIGAYLLSFLLPFLMGSRAIMVRYDGHYYFPAFRSYFYDTFGLGRNHVVLGSDLGQQDVFAEAEYRALKEQYEQENKGNFVIMPLIRPFGPYEIFVAVEGRPPRPPSAKHWMGTDSADRDIFVRLCYGYRISMSFALLVTGFSFVMGTAAGALLGYFGRWLDMLGLRFVEIWSAVPFLYTVIILASIFQPSFSLLVAILAVFGWMGITYYIRGEFYREKSKDYVAAAMAVGEGHLSIMFRHILPNALTPIITFAPFAIVAEIEALVALDFLGYGLPPPIASWGELLRQAKEAGMKEWHMTVFPLLIMFIALQLIVFIGEAVREAFDPKVFSRLR
ncbi:MAG: ABC transporter permease subunit [Planctomycetes bacterium]|nr:ABC transporter permease subunit [Planctomycetota bacterium]